MIIPIRCVTCGKVLANKWDAYQKKCAELEQKLKEGKTAEKEVKNFEPVMKGPILDELGLDKICCRRHMLTQVDLIDVI